MQIYTNISQKQERENLNPQYQPNIEIKDLRKKYITKSYPLTARSEPKFAFQRINAYKDIGKKVKNKTIEQVYIDRTKPNGIEISSQNKAVNQIKRLINKRKMIDLGHIQNPCYYDSKEIRSVKEFMFLLEITKVKNMDKIQNEKQYFKQKIEKIQQLEQISKQNLSPRINSSTNLISNSSPKNKTSRPYTALKSKSIQSPQNELNFTNENKYFSSFQSQLKKQQHKKVLSLNDDQIFQEYFSKERNITNESALLNQNELNPELNPENQTKTKSMSSQTPKLYQISQFDSQQQYSTNIQTDRPKTSVINSNQNQQNTIKERIMSFSNQKCNLYLTNKMADIILVEMLERKNKKPVVHSGGCKTPSSKNQLNAFNMQAIIDSAVNNIRKKHYQSKLSQKNFDLQTANQMPQSPPHLQSLQSLNLKEQNMNEQVQQQYNYLSSDENQTNDNYNNNIEEKNIKNQEQENQQDFDEKQQPLQNNDLENFYQQQQQDQLDDFIVDYDQIGQLQQEELIKQERKLSPTQESQKNKNIKKQSLKQLDKKHKTQKQIHDQIDKHLNKIGKSQRIRGFDMNKQIKYENTESERADNEKAQNQKIEQFVIKKQKLRRDIQKEFDIPQKFLYHKMLNDNIKQQNEFLQRKYHDKNFGIAKNEEYIKFYH